MTNDTQVRPVRQKIRIWILRLAFVAVLPVLVLTASAWPAQGGVAGVLDVMGILLVFAAVLGRFWAILYIGSRKNAEVMQDGPYSICRHPLYLFSTIGVAGFGLMLGSLVLAAGLTTLTFAILYMTAAKEEAYLRHQFGAAYDAYSARVPRILPRLGLFTTEPRVDVSIFDLRGNFMDALVFIGFIPLAKALTALHLAGVLPVLWRLV